MAVVIDENAGLVAKVIGEAQKRPKEKTCPVQVSVYDVIRVKIAETFGDIQ